MIFQFGREDSNKSTTLSHADAWLPANQEPLLDGWVLASWGSFSLTEFRDLEAIPSLVPPLFPLSGFLEVGTSVFSFETAFKLSSWFKFCLVLLRTAGGFVVGEPPPLL